MELELKSMTATEVGAFGCVRRSGHSCFSNVLGAFKVRYLQLVVNWLSAVVNWVNPLYLEKEPAIVSTARHFLESLIPTAADERIQFDLDHGIHDNNQTTKEDNSNKQANGEVAAPCCLLLLIPLLLLLVYRKLKVQVELA